MVSLISDGRVQFLLWFIIVALILAGTLTLIEFRLKRKKEKRTAETVNELAVEKVRHFLKNDKTPREKLDFIDKTAKEYFKETYGMPLNSGYSTLTEEFEKTQRNNEVAFCKAMFATYYSDKELDEGRVLVLGNLLIGIETNMKRTDKISKAPSFMEQVSKFLEKRKRIVLAKKVDKKEEKNFRILEQNKVECERNKLRAERSVQKKKMKLEGRRRAGKKTLSFINSISQFFEKRKRIALKKKIIREKERRGLEEKRKKLSVVTERNKEKLLATNKAEVHKLKIARAGIVEVKRERRKEKVKIYGENVRRLVLGAVDKLGALFGIGKVWKNKNFADANIIEKNEGKISPQKYTEIVKSELDENIKEKFFDRVRVHKGKEEAPLKRNNFFNYNYSGCKNLQSAGQESLQKQTADISESGHDVDIIKEGVAGRIIRKEKDRLKERGIFAVEI